MDFINIDKDKDGIRLKTPARKCIKCNKYPCFKDITKCKCNFAAYGCKNYDDTWKISSKSARL